MEEEKEKARFQGAKLLGEVWDVPTFLLMKEEKQGSKGRSPLAGHKESPHLLIKGKAGFQGAQPLGGVWGVPTFSFPWGGEGMKPLNLQYSPLSAIV